MPHQHLNGVNEKKNKIVKHSTVTRVLKYIIYQG